MRVQDNVLSWRSYMAERGVDVTCMDESVGGYPFRITFECSQPEFVIRTRDSQIRFIGAGLIVVAQAYDSDHMIAELKTPVQIDTSLDENGIAISIPSGTVRTSAKLVNGRLGELSAVLPAIKIMMGAGREEIAEYGANASEIHWRVRPRDDALDVALNVDQPYLRNKSSKTATQLNHIEAVVIVNHPVSVSFDTLAIWLKSWRENGGVADVTRLEFDSKYLSGEGAGTISLEAENLITGAFRVNFFKLDRFVSMLVNQGNIRESDANLLMGAVDLFAKSINGEKMVTLPVSIRGGDIYLGPVKAARLPALN